jgi:hypothetical protein
MLHLRESLRLFALLGNEPAPELARACTTIWVSSAPTSTVFTEAESEFGISLDLERGAACLRSETGVSQGEPGELNGVRGNFAEAERMYAAGLDKARQELGLDHPRTLTLNNKPRRDMERHGPRRGSEARVGERARADQQGLRSRQRALRMTR